MTTTPQKTAYGAKGLIGLLTPQDNTTAEPEFAILCPADVAFITARMVSNKDGMEARLLDYAETVEAMSAQFANAPINALAMGVTGPSYLIGQAAEDDLVEHIAGARGLPLITTATAVCDALALLEARSITLLSPYPESLTAKSAEYRASRGFAVHEIVQLQTDGDSFHPIYAMPADAATAALGAVKNNGTDAIVMLGTGMPTLAPLAACADWDGPPGLSSLFCLAWRAVAAASGREPDRADLARWMSAAHWRRALAD